MAGYYNSLRSDACNREFEDYQNKTHHDYTMNLAAQYRVGQPRPFPLAPGSQPTFWGPLRGVKSTQEAFLQGRGQSLSDCPDCDVRWLPESVFAQGNLSVDAQCQRTDLQPLYTRKPKSCNGLPETDTTQFSMMPSAWQNGYTGFRSVVDTNIQSRQAPSDTGNAAGSEAYGVCRKTYGSYGSGRDFSRYAS